MVSLVETEPALPQQRRASGRRLSTSSANGQDQDTLDSSRSHLNDLSVADRRKTLTPLSLPPRVPQPSARRAPAELEQTASQRLPPAQAPAASTATSAKRHRAAPPSAPPSRNNILAVLPSGPSATADLNAISISTTGVATGPPLRDVVPRPEVQPTGSPTLLPAVQTDGSLPPLRRTHIKAGGLEAASASQSRSVRHSSGPSPTDLLAKGESGKRKQTLQTIPHALPLGELNPAGHIASTGIRPVENVALPEIEEPKPTTVEAPATTETREMVSPTEVDDALTLVRPGAPEGGLRQGSLKEAVAKEGGTLLPSALVERRVQKVCSPACLASTQSGSWKAG
ncbi:hypothetical protein CYMTET_40728 [Cymbomonas tetramitiformis]|uniref:Uncharacterized protein n=1 Tax=Cymbomonas tetramitiformis TaxID=36881 RepID=A0AAE0F389_9CHLO|nr:hypothetical protein CYMTET_40728 [Cymbomonas tetramitiformis]